MKILWTTVALASSVTLGNAQQAPRPVTPTPPPAPRAAPAPRTAVEPLFPLSGQLLLPPLEMALPAEAPMALFPLLELAPVPALPALETPMALPPLMELTPLPALAPAESMLPEFPPMSASLAPLAMPALPVVVPDGPMALVPEPAWELLQGQGTPRPPRPVRSPEFDRYLAEVDRAEAARQRAYEAQDRVAQRQADLAVEQARRQLELHERTQQREVERLAQQAVRELEMQERTQQRQLEQQLAQIARQQEMQERTAQRELEQHLRSAQMALHADTRLGTTHFDFSNVRVPAPWAPQDVADSAYRQARELFNRGEYGQAAQAFRSLPTRFPNSSYAPEAAYYQAFALYRIGGTTELREALGAIQASRTRYPNAKSNTQAAALETRILGVLAQRGDAEASRQLTSRASGQEPTCDREEQAVQAEAMNALSRSDAGNVNELITRVLARRDECSIPLRRTAIFLVGNRRDAQAIGILSGVARNDPSVDVKVEAIGVIGRLPNDEGVTVLEELARSDDERIQRAAVRALVRHPSARARASVRSLVERDDVSERVRSEALSAFNADQATADDIAWLRALYAKVTTPTLKARTLSAIVRVGGPDVDQWLITIARDDNQPSEIRSTAMRRIGETLPIADLGRLYDGATQQRFRSEIISVLGKRKEDAAADKLIDIVKNGTDPSLRTAAIRAITNKNDARATQLLLEIINK